MPPMRPGSTSARCSQKGDGGVEVSLAAPAERVRVTLALTLAAAVEEEHSISVAGKHPGRPLRAFAARKGDDRRAVSRRDVPALELQPVAGLERDVLVGRAQLGLGDEAAGDVREDVCAVERGDDDVQRGHCPYRKQTPAAVSASPSDRLAAAIATRSRPRRRGGRSRPESRASR